MWMHAVHLTFFSNNITKDKVLNSALYLFISYLCSEGVYSISSFAHYLLHFLTMRGPKNYYVLRSFTILLFLLDFINFSILLVTLPKNYSVIASLFNQTGLKSVWNWFVIGLKTVWKQFVIGLQSVCNNSVCNKCVWNQFEIVFLLVCIKIESS